MPYKIAILASGSGTNAENIANYFADSDLARVALVLTNVRNAGVVSRMQNLGVDTYFVPNSEWNSNPQRIADFLEAENIDLVVLAGFMRKVSDEIVDRYRGRMLNIHPSLLPAYGGKGMYGHHVHEAVIAAGETQSGVTVHQVSEVMDGGEIVAQQSVEVAPDDTAETLEQKIHAVEYELYPRAIEQVLNSFGPTDATTASAPESEEKPVADQWASALGVDYDGQEAERRSRECMAAPPAEQLPPVYQTTPPPMYPASGAAQQPTMPSTYLLWSVLCLVFCCLPAGIVATIFSCQVSSKFYNGDYAGAEKASARAQIWIIVAFCLGVLQATILSPLYLLLSA